MAPDHPLQFTSLIYLSWSVVCYLSLRSISSSCLHDVVRLWHLDLYDDLYSFCLVCRRLCFSTTPTSTTLSPAVVSLLGSLVRNIVRSEMVSGHSPAGSVPAIPSAPLLVPTGSSSAPVVLSSTTPAGITSGMPCYSVSVMLGHPPTSIEFLPSNHNWSGYFYNKIKNKSKKEEACMTEGLYYWMGQVCLCGMA